MFYICSYKMNKSKGKNQVSLPLQLCKVEAGFPSPADNYIEKELNLHDYLIDKPEATFLVRAKGESMINAGIFSGDILIVDRSLHAKNNDIVIATINGELTVKKLIKNGKSKFPLLKSENPEYPTIRLTDDCDIDIWGIVTYSIHPLR